VAERTPDPRGTGADGRERTPVWPQPTEDRERAGNVLVVVIALLLGASFRLALGALEVGDGGEVFVSAAVVTAVLAVVALRSIPLRWIVRSYALVGAGLLARLGVLGDAGGVAGASEVLLWAMCTAGALALCPRPTTRPTGARPGAGSSSAAASSVGSPSTGASSPDSPTPDSSTVVTSSGPAPVSASLAAAPGTSRRADPWALARGAVTAAVLVAAVLLLVGSWAGERPPVTPSSGSDPDELDRGPQNPLSFQPRLDMTRRPRLSDAVVMTVRSDLVSFWRTATYDDWDGTTWRSSDGGSFSLVGPDGQVVPSREDLAARLGEESEQEFRLKSRFANTLPVAPSAVRVEAPGRLVQGPDGSLAAPDGLGVGATYAVTSRQVRVTGSQLAAIDATAPEPILDRYAAPPETSRRVRDLARQIVGEADADTAFAKVRALEAWMADNLEYSLDAPLAPQGVDVVDDFLFESKLGWCEQIASSLVVMLREVGVPARLAVGFAPGEQDPATGRFVVRERDAHAWAEVWFLDVGWIPFDPTAEVPFAGDADTERERPIGFAALAVLLLLVGAIAVASVPLARRLHAWRTRRAMRRAADRLAEQRWDVRVERELEQLGEEVGRPRAPAETVSAHARALAAVTGRAELAEQGEAVDRCRYDPSASDRPSL
jgi:transglutaminase-like putative cysteine protease